MNIKTILPTMGALSILLLSACGTDEDSNGSMNNENEKPQEEVEEDEFDEDFATKENPLNFGSTITINFIRENDEGEEYAYFANYTMVDMLRGEEVNDMLPDAEPKEGFEFAVVKAHVQFVFSPIEDETVSFEWSDFKFLSGENEYNAEEVNIEEDSIGLLKGDILPMEETEGYVVGQVEIGEDFNLSIEPNDDEIVVFDVE
ncbi:hypothetical protein [Jeotgalibacillus marinus]|uniref:DUF4352 domain-containing protein n=1 Tax=Jeotgalibacillus marinus TaxID=86667 RepID=A0ABV3Q844_9BACL